MNKLISVGGVLLATSLWIGCQQSTKPADQAGADSGSTGVSTKAGAKQELAIGQQAPTWQDIEGVDGQRHSLADLKEAEAVAIVFTCNHCPVAQAYEERLVELDKDYRDKGVALVAINVNNMEDDKLPAMKERAEQRGFEFAYLYDPSQQIGRAYGAMVTPHAFLLDKERKLAYRGAIDDNQNADKVERRHLREALDAVLAGKAPAEAETKQFGCGIKYE